VVSNPPYFEMSSGRESPDASRARARHDGSCTLDDVLDATRACLGPKGRLCVILPPGRMGSLIESASSRRLFATRLRPVYPKPGRASRQVLIELRLDASPGALVLEPPLLVHDLSGEYTPEAQDFLSGSFR
jgi:tRNA1Val (adenine37-N6)-methyltransferase